MRACSTVSVQWPQGDCSTFFVDCRTVSRHQAWVLSAQDILDRLKAAGITHERIARVLGVSTPNATRLYNPDPKTGKCRKLGYDEGVSLVVEFGLEDSHDETPIEPMAVPVARLAVQYVAQQLGAKIDPDDERVEDLAQDIRAYSEFVAAAQIGDNQERAQGWLDGRRSRTLGRA